MRIFFLYTRLYILPPRSLAFGLGYFVGNKYETNKDIDINQINEIKVLYHYYHMLYWCYNSRYKKLKRINIILILLANSLIAASATSVMRLNPIIIASLSLSGIIINAFLKNKNHDAKIARLKFASGEYKKALIFLRYSMREKNSYNHRDFILKMKEIDGIIFDLVPYISDNIKKQYAKKFDTN